MAETTYVLDANVFIEASRRYYPFDLVPPFWRSLETHAASGRVCSIDRVKAELQRGNDELATWVSDRFSAAFASTDDAQVIAAFREIMAWAQSQAQFTDAAKTAFAACADGWLVSYAQVNAFTVVTHEVFSPDVRIRVKVPNVCHEFGVPYVDTFTMLRGLGVRLG